MRYVVSGATGFIGINLVRRLAQQRGDTVICLVRNPERAKLIEPLGATIVYCDITRREAVESLSLGAIDVVFHCAGYVGSDRATLEKANVLATEHLCQWAKKIGARKFVHVSSASVVTGNKETVLSEDMPLCANGPYGESKLRAEEIIEDYRKKGLPAIIIRPCMVYGPGEPHAFGKLLFLIKHRLFPLFHYGKTVMHMVFIQNVVDLMLYSITRDEFLKGAYFSADKETLSQREVISLMAQEMNAPQPLCLPSWITPILEHIPYFGWRIRPLTRDRIYSTAKIESLGFRHRFAARESLIQTTRSFITEKSRTHA